MLHRRLGRLALCAAVVFGAILLWLLGRPAAWAEVGPSGAFTTSVPVTVPSFHGLQPQLSLAYSSQAGNGWVGEGWQLTGASVITRQSGVHGLPTWSGTDHYALDGLDLVACGTGGPQAATAPSCAHAVSGTIAYAGSIEDDRRISFSPNASGGTWTVWQTDGTTFTYQPVTSSTSGVLDWRVTTVRDTSGNTVTYHWTRSSGQQAQLSTITYGDVVIGFSGEARPDVITAADGDGLLTMSDRLARITETAAGKPLRSYRLTYVVHSRRTRESFLHTVQQVGSDGTTTYPAMMYATSPRHSVVSTTPTRSHRVAGLDDSSWPAGPNDSTRWAAALTGGQSGQLAWSEPHDGQRWLTGDLNRDERQDIVHVQTVTDADQDPNVIQVTSEINRDSGGYASQDSYLRFPWPTDPDPAAGLTAAQQTHNDIRDAAVQLADVNGDGYPDLVLTVQESTGVSVAVALNTSPAGAPGRFAASTAPLTTLAGGGHSVVVADVTGDADGDLVVETSLDQQCAGDAPSLHAFLGDGTGRFAPGPVSCLPEAVGSWHAVPVLDPVDLNGDLKSDLADYLPADEGSHLHPGPSTAQIVTAISRGDGHFATAVFDTGQPWTDTRWEGSKSCATDGDPIRTCGSFETADQPALWGTFDTRPGTDLTVLTEADTSPCSGIQHGTIVAHVFSSLGDGTFSRHDWSTSLPDGSLSTIVKKHGWDSDGCVQPTPADDVTKVPVQVQAADVTGDGIDDLVALTRNKDGDTYTGVTRLVDDERDAFLADGPSRSVDWAVADCASIVNDGCARPLVATGDVNGDGRDDIMVITGRVGGQATTATDLSSPGPSLTRILTGDVNGDGRPDRVSVTMASDTAVQVRTSLGRPDGGYQATPPVTVSVAGAGIIHLPADGWRLADLTGDHRADLVDLPPGQRSGVLLVATPGEGWVEQTPTLSALDRTSSTTGHPTAHPRPTCTYGGPGHHLDCDDDGDDGDGGGDAGDGGATTNTVPALLPAIGSWQLADVTGDGITDLVHAGPGPAPWNEPGVLVLAGSADGHLAVHWTPAPDATTAAALTKPLGWHTADVNGDGKADLVNVDTSTGATHTLVSHGSTWSVAAAGPSLGTGQICRPGTRFCQRSSELTLGIGTAGDDDAAWTPVDVNGDGMQDLARVVPDGNRLDAQTLISRGDGTFQRVDDLAWESSPAVPDAVADGDTEDWQAADVDLDGRGDLVKATQTGTTLRVDALLSDGTGQWTHRQWETTVSAGGTGWQVEADSGPLQLTHLTGASAPALEAVTSGVAPDTITTTRNGLGATTHIAYQPGASFLPVTDPVEAACATPQGSVPYVATRLGTSVVAPGLARPAGAGSARTGAAHGALRVVGGRTTRDTSTLAYSCPRYSVPLGTFVGWQDTWTRHAAATSPVTGGVARPASIEHLSRAIDVVSGIDHVAVDETTDGTGGLLRRTTTEYEPTGSAPPYLDQVSRTDTGPCTGSTCSDTVTTLTHDADGNVTRQVDTAAGDGRQRTTTTQWLYDDLLWLRDQPRRTTTTQPGPEGGTTTLADTLSCYDHDTTPQCDSPQASTARGLVTLTRAFDDDTDTWITTSTHDYDGLGNAVRSTDADGEPTTTTYDPSGLFPVRTCNALDQCSSTTDWSRVSEQPGVSVAVNGGRTTTRTDALGRTERIVGPTGIRTHITYRLGPAGTLTTTRTRAGGLSRWTSTLTDGLGHTIRTRTAGPDGHTVQSETLYLDATLPALSDTTHDTGAGVTDWTATTYDALGRSVATTHADGAISRTAYAVDNGYLVTTSTPENHHQVTTRTTDGWGDVTAVSQASPEHPGTQATVRYTDDVLGHETSITDPHGNTERLTYNTLGQNTVDDDPDRGVTTYAYDPAGLLLSTTDARGRVTTTGYDRLGRPTRSLDGATHEVRTWTYDAGGPADVGHLTSETDPSATGCAGGTSHRWTYTVLGDIAAATQCTHGLTATTHTTYDALDRPRSTTYPDGLTVTQTYDAAGALTAVPGFVSAVTYTPDGSPQSVQYANGTRSAYAYSPTRGWLTRHDVVQIATGAGLFTEAYTHDAVGTIRTAASGDSTTGGAATGRATQRQRYTYNALDELTTVTDAGTGHVEQSLSYDDSGNIRTNTLAGAYGYPSRRTCTTASTCAGPDAATTVGTHSYTYDADGDTLTDRVGTATTHYAWTTDGMLASIRTPSGSTVTNTYDADDQLVEETDAHGTTTYVGSLATHTRAGWRDAVYLGSTLVAEHTASGTSWDVTDHQGSTRATTDRFGRVTSRTSYTAYGAAQSPTDRDHGYTAARRVGTSRLLDLNARDYDPDTGRFLSADTIRPGDTAVGANRYTYVDDDPVDHTDPSGHAETSCTDGSCFDVTGWNNFLATAQGYATRGLPSSPGVQLQTSSVRVETSSNDEDDVPCPAMEICETVWVYGTIEDPQFQVVSDIYGAGLDESRALPAGQDRGVRLAREVLDRLGLSTNVGPTRSTPVVAPATHSPRESQASSGSSVFGPPSPLIFTGPMAVNPPGFWTEPWNIRGYLSEWALGGMNNSFPTIDQGPLPGQSGPVTSIKTMDTLAPSYQTRSGIYSRIMSYVRSLAAFNGGSTAEYSVDQAQITGRTLRLGIRPQPLTMEQKLGMEEAILDGEAMGVGVEPVPMGELPIIP